MTKVVFVLLNSKAGALRGVEAAATIAKIESAFSSAGWTVEMAVTSGHDCQRRVEDRIAANPPDAVVVGGGDGTVSFAAALLTDTGIALGVLPLGTMNLFARSLGMPLDLDEALAVLATAAPRRIDMGEVNGRLFTHHLSIGLQPRMVALREKGIYGSKLAKQIASLWAFLTVLSRPSLLALRATVDGRARDVVTPAMVISNNVYGPDHLPYADTLDAGVLGIYICTSVRTADLAQITLETLLGNWHADGRIDTLTAKAVTIERRKRRRNRILATIDGELETFQGRLEVRIRPQSLTVLANGPQQPPR